MVRSYFSPRAMREADERAASKFRVPSLILMENAGRGAASIILDRYPEAGSFLVLCGPGNNGGDGCACARHLALNGADVVVLSTVRIDQLSGDARAMAEAVDAAGTFDVSTDLSDDEIEGLAWGADIVIDALLGTGSSGAPRGEVERLISLCCDGMTVVSLDIPSGVDAETGAIPGKAVDADMTVTFLAAKSGLAIAPGCVCAGEVIECEIGVAGDVIEDMPRVTGWEEADIETLTPCTSPTIHKRGRGGLIIIGGSDTYRGAPVLTARAALRAGCGFVFLALPDVAAQSAAAELPEAIILSIPSEDGVLRHSSLEDAFAPWNDKIDAAVIGPGLGRSQSAETIVRHAVRFLRTIDKPLLLDADALVHLAAIDDNGGPYGHLLITPHTGEASRLLKRDPAEIDNDRLAAVEGLAKRYGAALLKGAHTMISNGSETRVLLEGGPELAVPGSGDVLSGIIGALMARGMDLTDAATLGALVHAVSGSRTGRLFGLMAREIADGAADVLSGVDRGWRDEHEL